MLNRLTIHGCIFLLAVSFYSCRALSFYGNAGEPFFLSSNKNIPLRESFDSITVVTFNIKKARKIDKAVSELRELDKISPVDIYLLQEMDETGVKLIASELGLNYLYIPVSYDKADKKNIGNAILTKGTIEHPEKLILPHAKWQNQQRRAVIIGEVNLQQRKIIVLSVHTETIAMSRRMRMDQVDAVISYAKKQVPHYDHILIGGDFNTAFPVYARSVITKFKENGFDWSTSEAGSTAKAVFGLIKPTNDYFFSSGFTFVNAFTVRSSRSSDHWPLLATFKF